MGVTQFPFSDAVPERSTWRYQTTIASDTGVLVNPADVLSIKLWLRDVSSDTIVNSRTNIEVNNTNGGTVTVGQFVFQFTEADSVILGTTRFERRLMTLDFHLSGGGRTTHEVRFYVRNLRDIA